MENLRELQNYLPQLIVALDSLEENANYIHIKDVKENTVYYCPCCKGVVKPRAYKDGKDYQVQSHFYHENGGCNDEAFMHYICKTWLFESGCKFKVNDELYTVGKIETEKTFHTKFGDYRPDITVYTKENKTFFFEIKNTNKKTENYIPKWDELENDVIEVDVRYFINQKVDSNIPEFKLIYSNGECFIKTYTRNDYEETIARRKMEWKRQDKINYKMMWEKLDWFWIELQRFNNNEGCVENILKSFSSLNFYDMEDCWIIIKKMRCLSEIKEQLKNIANSIAINYINDNILPQLLENINICECNLNVNKTTVKYNWVVYDNFNSDNKYTYSYSLKNRSNIINSTYLNNFKLCLLKEIDESLINAKSLSEKFRINRVIEKSRLDTKNIVLERQRIKQDIQEQTKIRNSNRLCRLMSSFIGKKLNTMVDVFVFNDYIYIQCGLIKIKFYELSRWKFQYKFEKDKFLEITNLIKNTDLSNLKDIKEIDFYNYKSLTRAIENSNIINDSTIIVNKVLMANKIINEDKCLFTDKYNWLIETGMCKKYYNNYYNNYYESLSWNDFGIIWLEQNWVNFIEKYKTMKINYETVLNYLNSFIKEYPIVKITKHTNWSDSYILTLELSKYPNDYSTLIEISTHTYDFWIGDDYTDNIMNFNYEKAEKSMKKFLLWFIYDKERNNIRFFRQEEDN